MATAIKIPAQLCQALLAADGILVLTGAGTSAESGVPTFRDAQTGLWEKFRPEDLATPQAFQADPENVWAWYQWRRELVLKAHPNAGHLALASLQELLPGLMIVTQNVDGLHQRGGAQGVIELHGNILRSVCSVTGRLISAEQLPADGPQPPPSPHHPAGLARPDVVWFGEALPAIALNQAMEAAERCDVCLSIGTSAMVEPAASLPRMAHFNGARVVEINPAGTPLAQIAHWSLSDTSATVLPALADSLKKLIAQSG